MTLFDLTSFTSHSGLTLPFKVDCDALTDRDLACVADLIVMRFYPHFIYSAVIGVPRGGTRLAERVKDRLREQVRLVPQTPRRFLVVDDVLTTGGSMDEARRLLENEHTRFTVCDGAVIFARGPTPDWVKAVWHLDEECQ